MPRHETRDGTSERRILTGMIVDAHVCAHLAARWTPEGLFRTRYANLIAGWCIKHHHKYGRAPGKAIETIAESWAERGKDKDTVALVDRFLSTLSDEYESSDKEHYNSDYILDLAGKYFNKIRLRQLAEGIIEDIDGGREDEAEVRLKQHTRIEVGVGAGIDVLQDVDNIRAAFEEDTEPIVEYPGDLGKFLNVALERDAFVAWQGKMGSGKTWFLIDLAWRAMLQRCRVAFFEIGDMSLPQITRRFMIRCAKTPRRASKVAIPESLTPTNDYDCEVKHTYKKFEQPLSWKRAADAAKRLMRAKLRSKNPYLKLSCHPARSININQIKSIVEGWARDGWVADVILVDYMDLLAPLPGTPRESRREQINEDWITARQLSQVLHCLLVTATQSDANSYGSVLQRSSNFTDDRRKNDHVTSMLYINQTDAEKDEGKWRIQIGKLRDEDFNLTRVCHIAGCLAVGNPIIKSRLWTPPGDGDES